MSHTPEDIESLVELFNRSDWAQMHLKTDGLEIFLSNDPHARLPTAQVAVAAPAPPPIAVTASAAPVTAAAVVHSQAIPDGMHAVLAPNLGTFYRAPKPGAPAYVELGQSVTADSEVCLIEVMKLFTPVKAGVAGTVREIRVNDGQMVEFEQILVIIEPAR
jgi:acetyl-CoA carboxylase biotin carboxyl carrier protein